MPAKALARVLYLFMFYFGAAGAQVLAHGGGIAPPPPPPPPPSDGKYGGPKDGTGPSTPGPGSPSAPKPSTPSGPAPAGGPTTGKTARPGTVVSGLDEGWLSWWQMNSAEFLRPNRLGAVRVPVTGDEFRTKPGGDSLEQLKEKLIPLLVSSLDDPDHVIRGSAALALGKIAGRAAIPHLRRRFEDVNPQVRHGAILGLGATGAEEAVPLLLRIAEQGSGEENKKISFWARPFAIVALGIGRNRGFSARIDPFVAAATQTLEKKEKDEIGVAALVYEGLAPSPALEPFVLQTAANTEEPTPVRCRALEALAAGGNMAHLTKLVTALSDPKLDVRRSAAIGLGGFRDPSALSPLQSTFEKDKDELVRGFCLISLGRCGGEPGRKLLGGILRAGSDRMRPWAALGLGLSIRSQDDPLWRKAIRDAFDREGSQDCKGAYLVACGIARDTEATPLLEKVLMESKDTWLRTHAALSLVLTGSPSARDRLLARLPLEKAPSVKGVLALGLGYLGDPRDAGVLVQTLRELKHPSLQGLFALALGYHGTHESLLALTEMAKDPTASNPARSAAIEALGVLLSQDPTPVVTRAARQANYTVFPDWLQELLQFMI